MVSNSCPVSQLKQNYTRSDSSSGIDSELNSTFRTVRSRLSSFGGHNHCSLDSVCLSKSQITGSSQISFSLSEDQISLVACENRYADDLLDTINALTDRVNSIESRLVDMEESYPSRCPRENVSAVGQIGSIVYRLIKHMRSTACNHWLLLIPNGTAQN